MKIRKHIWILIVMAGLCLSQNSYSQILDDSTELVYGAYTTFYNTFDKIKNNNYTLTKIDTLISGIHNFDMVSGSQYKYQDLGIIGSSIRPLFYQPPEQIGARSGFDSYSEYYTEKEDIKFFDTKSPYTRITANFGGGRRAITKVRHTRNINPFWNAGFYFERYSIEKQISSSGRDDRQVVSTSYHFHTHYQSESGRYVGLAVLSRMNHEAQESGGIDTTSFQVPQSDAEFFDEDTNVLLENAESSDLRINFFTYHELKWKKTINFYYLWEQISNKYAFIDLNLQQQTQGTNRDDAAFFDQILINEDSTTDRARFRQSIHEPGIKGTWGGFYYNAHLKLRKINYLHQYLPYDENKWETYAGFEMRFDFDTLKNHNLNLKGEYLLGAGYKLRGDYTNKFFSAIYQKTRYQPSIIQQNYFGNHDEWHNSFDPINSDYIHGRLDIDLKSIRVAPKLTLANINHNVYYDQDGRPIQAGGNAQIISPGLELDFNFFNNSLHLHNEAVYTRISGDSKAADAFRIPEIFVNSRLFFGKPVFDGKINVETGIQAHYKSDYYSVAYDPAIRQFYVQDNFQVPAYLLVDLFLDFRIDHVAAFLRYEHFNQQTNDGYFTIANYVGQKKVFSIGVSWLFFD